MTLGLPQQLGLEFQIELVPFQEISENIYKGGREWPFLEVLKQSELKGHTGGKKEKTHMGWGSSQL